MTEDAAVSPQQKTTEPTQQGVEEKREQRTAAGVMEFIEKLPKFSAAPDYVRETLGDLNGAGYDESVMQWVGSLIQDPEVTGWNKLGIKLAAFKREGRAAGSPRPYYSNVFYHRVRELMIRKGVSKFQPELAKELLRKLKRALMWVLHEYKHLGVPRLSAAPDHMRETHGEDVKTGDFVRFIRDVGEPPHYTPKWTLGLVGGKSIGVPGTWVILGDYQEFPEYDEEDPRRFGWNWVHNGVPADALEVIR